MRATRLLLLAMPPVLRMRLVTARSRSGRKRCRSWRSAFAKRPSMHIHRMHAVGSSCGRLNLARSGRWRLLAS
jgi:hypothetical protein